MKEKIFESINRIEENFGVKILYVCEAGSRAWGIESSESDYDVRFIYVHPIADYLCIDSIGSSSYRKDYIELPTNNKLDMSGWELTKALKLFRKSNPSLLEWLHSDTVYYEKYSAIERMKELLPEIFSMKSCLFHYAGMAETNIAKCLKANSITIKDLLNVIRPILIWRWMQQMNTFPPLHIDVLLQKAKIDESFSEIINELIELKKENFQDVSLELKEFLVPFLKDEILAIKQYAEKLTVQKQNPTEQLNRIFRDTLKEVWSYYGNKPIHLK